jgi:NodT family efflux transporter outer membrane factor (OMF) lipoprotein
MKKNITYALLLGLSACAVGPDYVKPDVATPSEFKEAAGWKQAQPQDNFKRNKWWKAFDDSDLDDLEERVNVSNQNIKLAEAQYHQATALVKETQASFFPTISLDAAETRSGAGSAPAGTTSSRRGIHNLYSTSLTASWEPDFWGKVRRQLESSEATEEAFAADLELARLSMQATLASDYLQLRVLDAQQRLLDNAVADYEKSLKVTQNQYSVGVAARSDVVQAETQLHTTKAQAIDIGVQRAQLEHAIAILVGVPPAEFSITPVNAIPAVPDIPVAVPSALLERRPDIAAAERNAAAANAQIGVTEAAWFPNITLSAQGGFENGGFVNWLTVPNRFWSIGPSLVETVFDAGLRSAQTEAAVAVYDQNVATYRQTVLAGFQEVEDNLASLRILGEEAMAQRVAVESAEKEVAIVLNQYKAGTVSYLNVVVAQTTALTNERTELTILSNRLVAAATLIKALGGGWNPPEQVVSQPVIPETDDQLCSVDHLSQRQFYLLNPVELKP